MTLIIEDVTKKFGDFQAVEKLSLTVSKGTMFGYLGANGAGKTTTFRMILGLLEPTSGTITWNGGAISLATSSQIGYLPEERGLYPKMTVEEQLIYLAQLRGMKKQQAREALAYWLERFDISHYANKKVEQLSKGNQQKVQVIAAVLHNPDLIILDEPFSGLDPVNVELLKGAVRELRDKGATIIFSSHRMDHVEELCEQLCILHKGKMLVKGTLKDIKRSFGKAHIRIHSEHDLSSLAQIDGVVRMESSVEGFIFQVTNEAVGHQLLQRALAIGEVRYFAIEEPTLQEIFIETVGGHHA